MEQIIYPWGIYETAEIEAIYITPYLDAVKKVLSWSGTALPRTYISLRIQINFPFWGKFLIFVRKTPIF